MRTTQTICPTRTKGRPTANGRKNQKEKMATCAAGATMPHMLNRKLPRRSHHLYAAGFEEIEHRFFSSLDNICRTHHIKMPLISTAPFPHNIIGVFDALQGKWDRKSPTELLILCAEGVSGAIATIEDCPKDYDLYHINILKLYQHRGAPNRGGAVEALVQTCAYLYHHLGFGHYIGNNIISQALSYIWTYLYDYEDEDSGSAERESWKKGVEKDYDEAKDAGYWLEQQMGINFQPERWEAALEHFNPADDWEKKYTPVAPACRHCTGHFPHTNWRI
ncbi:hypothetical protein WJU16_02920 [Chitinophaga pollutisoli]|uniref:Uncharacterized protein n=1 Tax=Chitinophaga pollutisoli TaxID=3133966 RepID=A0ABZ2YR23_9BACT